MELSDENGPISEVNCYFIVENGPTKQLGKREAINVYSLTHTHPHSVDTVCLKIIISNDWISLFSYNVDRFHNITR